ncbi:MAG: hypothetical protein AAFQ71_10230 [Planctomycetota bacterium]
MRICGVADDDTQQGEEKARLAGWLADHDEPCPNCGYGLRGVPEPVCPECSAPIRLGVVAPHMRFGPWAVAMLGPALALGFDGVIVLLTTWQLIITGGLPTEVEPLYWGLVALGGLCLLGIALLISRRARWMALDPGRQWRIGWSIFVGVGVVHAAFGFGWFAIFVL